MNRSLFKTWVILFLVINSFTAQAQSSSSDSFTKVLLTEKEDTNKFNTLIEFASKLMAFNADSSIILLRSALILATKLNYKMGIADVKTEIGKLYATQGKYNEGMKSAKEASSLYQEILTSGGAANNKKTSSKLADSYNALLVNVFPQGNYPEALKIVFLELKIREEIGDSNGISKDEFNIGNIYYCQRNYSEALKHHFICLAINRKLGSKSAMSSSYNAIGLIYFDQGNYGEALMNYSNALKLAQEAKDTLNLAEVYVDLGVIKDKLGNFDEALKYNFAALRFYERIGMNFNIPFALNNIGVVYMKQKKYREASEYLANALSEAKRSNHIEYIKLSYENMTKLDSTQGHFKKALEDYQYAITYRDSLVNKENTQKITQQQMQYEFDKKESIEKTVQQKKDAEQKRIKNQQFFTITALGIIVLAGAIIAIIQFRSNRHKQQANFALKMQKDKVEATLLELKSAQAQLIQSEKMASLGELTAGIAHEIQNPLNFVNNFSEINRDLLEELKSEKSKLNSEELDERLNDIADNEEKINHHGKRADAIVKGMLQHSRANTGKKEPTDINALADENLRLSFHGKRTKDKDFNATITTNFDESIGKINIVPQDIGRALLNLYNNAFYSINEKRKQFSITFEPTVEVTTRRVDNKVEISVKDNGNGIPQKIVDKIYQPFFTTKPTGQGTGLGLSMCYDIIKSHGGEIKVETKEGEGSEFIIDLPV